ncbi:MAG: aminoacyl-tRNA hydrolase [Verrucomicrobiota bacterium]
MCNAKPKLVVGLGNPGGKYENTRHNAGFLVINALRKKLGRAEKKKRCCRSILYQTSFAGDTLYLAKPQTFMNRSGEAVVKLQQRLKLAPEEVLIVYDCLDIPMGRIRLRAQGGNGGHKGMGSILVSLATQQIPRLRFGIGRDEEAETVDYVLDEWSTEERERIDTVIEVAADAVLTAVKQGLNPAMEKYNNWQLEETISSDTDG